MLVVGEDPGEARARCRVVVRPGLESRVAQPVPLDDLVVDFRPDLIHLHNVTNPLVLEWAAMHRTELMEDWQLCESRQMPKKIEPLWTWPVWMYVSVTGVLIYFLLYQIFPQR